MSWPLCRHLSAYGTLEALPSVTSFTRPNEPSPSTVTVCSLLKWILGRAMRAASSSRCSTSREIRSCSGPSSFSKSLLLSVMRRDGSAVATVAMHGSAVSSARSPKWSPAESVVITCAVDVSDSLSTCKGGYEVGTRWSLQGDK